LHETFVAPAHWRAIDFISDLHLAGNTPRAFEAWAGHLRHTAADAVFILGDLFDVWIGDDMAERGFEARCAAVLSEAAQVRTIAFMPGNRDFLVGDAMLRSTGVRRLRDPTLVEAFGDRVLVSHGDALCLGDVAYQRYRAIVHRRSLQRIFAALPFSLRSAVGRAMRSRGGRPGGGFVDIEPEAATQWTRAAGASTLVHGHTHAPASHALAPGIVRHVLSDWELDGGGGPPRAEILRWQAGGFSRIAPEGQPTAASTSP
jgi:UDP-2,3-diacylglucosamine hydrolase